MFLEISQNSQENTCAGVSFSIKLQVYGLSLISGPYFPVLGLNTGKYRSKKGVLRNFAKFTEKHQCRSLFFNKVAGLRPVTYLWSVFSCIGTEYRKIQIRKNSAFGHFSRSESVKKSSGTHVFLGILRQFQEHPFL